MAYKNSFKKEEIEYIKKNYKIKTNQEIADYLNCNKQKVNQTLSELNLTRREKLNLIDGEYFVSMEKLGFSKYKISNKGRFINLKNEIIQQTYTNDGYLSVKLVNDNGKRITNRSSRLVALIFIPNDDPENKTEVNHIYGIKDRNYAEDLEWVTPSENQKHAYKIGLRVNEKGERSKLSKHTEKDVRKVCDLLSKNKTPTEINKLFPEFNISWIKGIKRKERWKHISNEYTF